MKKIDTTKPVVRMDGAPAKFLHRFDPDRRTRNCLWIVNCDNDCEDALFTDDYGFYDRTQLIKNVPETITFWVPVFIDDGGNLQLTTAWISQSIERPKTDCHSPYTCWKWVGWKGPFTISND